METVHTYRKPMELIGELSAVVTVPTGFDKTKESLPVIVFLHGSGERGDGSDSSLEAVKIHAIPKLFSNDPDYHGLRVITVSPQCPYDLVWDHLTLPLMKWIEDFVAEYNGDTDRVSITGLSLGGFGTWDLITTFPDKFSCAAPVCGGGKAWRCEALGGKKIRVYHGIDDDAVPFVYSQLMVEAAKEAGADITLYAKDHVGHGVWVYAYEQTDLVEWLVAQKR